VVGTSLLRLTTTDADYTHDNTNIEYSIVTSTSSRGTGPSPGPGPGPGPGTGTDGDDGLRCFSMTESTGELILTSSLDHERTDRYELTVTATDRGQPALTATTTVSTTAEHFLT